ncbi:MAG TPA: hypothetical protein EYQ24_11050 [Bacteroidetes bacterium]|nr:hypothetical protein [Bacteroidota bacterium]
MTYDVRPQHMGSWTFLFREGTPKGRLAADVRLGGIFDEGSIRVGEIPFELDRDGISRAYRLRFEGRTLALAEPEGPLSGGYDLRVEAAVLSRNVPIGERVWLEWVPDSFSGRAFDLRDGGVLVGRMERTARLFRHFSLSLDDDVPLAIGAFCMALALARLRRQSRSG